MANEDALHTAIIVVRLLLIDYLTPHYLHLLHMPVFISVTGAIDIIEIKGRKLAQQKRVDGFSICAY